MNKEDFHNSQLKYLFSAVFDDGEVYNQNTKDEAVFTTYGSSFTDIIEKQKTKKLLGFALNDVEGNEYFVDLTDGHFEINGCQIWLSNEEIKNIRLIYFRDNLSKLNFNEGLQQTQILNYNFGWQANDINNKNIKKIITLK